MSHARLSPSSAGRWTKCPGSLRLIAERDIQDSAGLAAEEGTAAHELLENALLENKHPKDFKGAVYNKCEVKPEGFEVDDEMIDHITGVWQWIIDYQEKTGAEVFAERKVNPGALFGRDDCEGTADVTMLHPPRITMGDLKYGKGVVVEVKDNLQELLYAIGVIQGLTPEQRREIKEVELVIMQPRAFHPDGPIRSIVYSIEDIYAWAEWFRDRADETDNPDAILKPGESQCRFCPVKFDSMSCPALREKSLEVFNAVEIKDLEPKVLRDPATLNDEERRIILDNAALIESFIKAVKSTAQNDLEAGKPVPGMKLVRGKKGNRKFEDEAAVVKAAKALGLKKDDIYEPPKLKGVAKIQAAAKKSEKFTEKKMEKLDALIVQPEGKLVMAPESDTREAVGSQRVDDAFKDVKLPKPEGDSNE